MSQLAYPRSPKALLGGIAHLGQFIDKIRLRNDGRFWITTTSPWGLIST